MRLLQFNMYSIITLRRRSHSRGWLSGWLLAFVAWMLCACGTEAATRLNDKGAERPARASALTAAERTYNAARDTDAGIEVEVLYWNNKNLGFGHIAVAVHGLSAMDEIVYVSYAMGNDYDVDRSKHGKDPVRLLMPPPPVDKSAEFLAWFAASPYSDPYSSDYGADYSLLRHNCAHAALNILRALGYDLAIRGDRPWALRPGQVYRAAKAWSVPSSPD